MVHACSCKMLPTAKHEAGSTLLQLKAWTCCLVQAPASPSPSKGQARSSPSKAGKKLLGMLRLRKATERAIMQAIGAVPAKLRHIPVQVSLAVNTPRSRGMCELRAAEWEP